MKITNILAESLLHFFFNKSQALLFIADQKGRIESANNSVYQLLGDDVAGSFFQDFIIDFRGIFSFEECVSSPSTKRLFNLSIPDQSPRSYFFSFLAADNKVIVVGETDGNEMERMRMQLTETTSDLGNLTRELYKKNKELEKSLDEIKTLEGIIPICMHCNQIRDDEGYWNRLEAYITSHSDAEFSHSICEKCYDEHYSDLD
jgi:hypothetical protein